MSRWREYDNDDENWALDMGRWEHNTRVALKGKRGRKALALLREALMALPEHRLIDSAVCTVGGVDKRVPAMTEQEVAEYAAQTRAGGDPKYAAAWAESMRREREDSRERLAEEIREHGEGVCAMGAYLWYQKVKAGVDPAEAFDALPTVFDSEGGDPLHETAELGRDAGLTFTLAYELAYRNDETYERMTPEERHAAFVAWIDAELAETSVSA
jgi:hypothetical protein